MNLDIRVWEESAPLSLWKSRNAPASSPARWFSDTFNAAAPPALLIAFWQRVMDWAPSTWCIVGEFGQMAALRGNKIISISLAEAIASNRKVDKEILDAATGILDKLDYKAAKS